MKNNDKTVEMSNYTIDYINESILNTFEYFRDNKKAKDLVENSYNSIIDSYRNILRNAHLNIGFIKYLLKSIKEIKVVSKEDELSLSYLATAIRVYVQSFHEMVEIIEEKEEFELLRETIIFIILRNEIKSIEHYEKSFGKKLFAS